MSTDIKLQNKVQTSKISIGGSFGSWLGNLGKSTNKYSYSYS